MSTIITHEIHTSSLIAEQEQLILACTKTNHAITGQKSSVSKAIKKLQKELAELEANTSDTRLREDEIADKIQSLETQRDTFSQGIQENKEKIARFIGEIRRLKTHKLANDGFRTYCIICGAVKGVDF